MKNNAKKKGFTLIELIIVIAILGILATIAIPRFSNYREKAAVSADIASAKTIANAAAIALADGEAVAGEVKSGSTLANYLNDIPTVQSGDDKGSNFTVVVTGGKVNIEIKSTQIYPTDSYTTATTTTAP